jgi:hypothetical protein
MPELPAVRLVAAVLRCYPARWRRRHGDEAAELAALLISDGTPAGSIALSYLFGATRERLRLTLRLRTVAAAMLVAVCSLGLTFGVLSASVPASAASRGRVAVSHRPVSRVARCHGAGIGPVHYEVRRAENPHPAASSPAGRGHEGGHDQGC